MLLNLTSVAMFFFLVFSNFNQLSRQFLTFSTFLFSSHCHLHNYFSFFFAPPFIIHEFVCSEGDGEYLL
jgi:hypothetical protein